MILQQLLLVDPTNGRIVGFLGGNGQVDISHHHEGLEIYESEAGALDSNLWYVDKGEIVPRPDCPVQLAYTPARNVVVLNGVPKDTVVKLRGIGIEHDIIMEDDDGQLKLEFPHGHYEIVWESFPNRAFYATVDM